MKRVFALAVACLLVAGAMVLRDTLNDDDEDGDDDAGSSGDLVVACIPELEDACRALEDVDLRIEDPAATIADPDVDAWVTLDPWPEIANELEASSPFVESRPVAQSEVVLLVRTGERPDSCDPLTWTCVIDGLDDRVLLPGRDTAFGALAFGHVAEVIHPDLIRADILGDPELDRRLRALETTDDPIGDIFAFGPAGPLATAATAADLARRFDGRREDGNFTRSDGGHPATVAVVVAGAAASRIGGDDALTDALEDLGWTLDPEAATTGLPSAGVLIALSEEVPS